MPGQVKGVRSYNSPLHADQALQTRRKVLESARRLFVERGYAGTTVAVVADDAGVSPETIYLSLGGKRGLLEGVMDITGPHDSAADDDKWWHLVDELASPLPAWTRWSSTAAGSSPAPARSTPSSAAPRTRRRLPPTSAGDS